MSETAKTGAEQLEQSEDEALLAQLTNAPPAPKDAAAEDGEGDAGSIPEPQEIPQTPEAPQPVEPPQPAEPYQPPEWMNVGPRDNLPKIEGVPYDPQGKRPSEVIRNTIDFDKLRTALADSPELFEQIESRFRGMYRENKALDRYLNQLGNDNLLLQEAESERQDTAHREQTKSQISEALEGMDYSRVAELITQKPPRAQAEDTQPQADPQTLEAIHAWESETDANGELMRPYVQDGHPLRDFAMTQAQSLLNHPNLKYATTEQVLATLDQVMANVQDSGQQQYVQQQPAQQQPKPTAPEVISGDVNTRTSPASTSANKIVLSREQKTVAERIFSRLTPKHAHQKYLSGMKRAGS